MTPRDAVFFYGVIVTLVLALMCAFAGMYIPEFRVISTFSHVGFWVYLFVADYYLRKPRKTQEPDKMWDRDFDEI